MFKKIIAFGIVLVGVIAGFVLANPHPHHGGHHGLSLPVVHLNLGGVLGLLKNPPIPIVRLPPLPLPQLPSHNIPIPFISLPFSDHHGHHGGHHGLPDLPIGDLLNTIIGGNSWDSWA